MTTAALLCLHSADWCFLFTLLYAMRPGTPIFAVMSFVFELACTVFDFLCDNFMGIVAFCLSIPIAAVVGYLHIDPAAIQYDVLYALDARICERAVATRDRLCASISAAVDRAKKDVHDCACVVYSEVRSAVHARVQLASDACVDAMYMTPLLSMIYLHALHVYVCYAWLKDIGKFCLSHIPFLRAVLSAPPTTRPAHWSSSDAQSTITTSDHEGYTSDESDSAETDVCFDDDNEEVRYRLWLSQNPDYAQRARREPTHVRGVFQSFERMCRLAAERKAHEDERMRLEQQALEEERIREEQLAREEKARQQQHAREGRARQERARREEQAKRDAEERERERMRKEQQRREQEEEQKRREEGAKQQEAQEKERREKQQREKEASRSLLQLAIEKHRLQREKASASQPQPQAGVSPATSTQQATLAPPVMLAKNSGPSLPFSLSAIQSPSVPAQASSSTQQPTRDSEQEQRRETNLQQRSDQSPQNQPQQIRNDAPAGAASVQQVELKQPTGQALPFEISTIPSAAATGTQPITLPPITSPLPPVPTPQQQQQQSTPVQQGSREILADRLAKARIEAQKQSQPAQVLPQTSTSAFTTLQQRNQHQLQVPQQPLPQIQLSHGQMNYSPVGHPIVAHPSPFENPVAFVIALPTQYQHSAAFVWGHLPPPPPGPMDIDDDIEMVDAMDIVSPAFLPSALPMDVDWEAPQMFPTQEWQPMPAPQQALLPITSQQYQPTAHVEVEMGEPEPLPRARPAPPPAAARSQPPPVTIVSAPTTFTVSMNSAGSAPANSGTNKPTRANPARPSTTTTIGSSTQIAKASPSSAPATKPRSSATPKPSTPAAQTTAEPPTTTSKPTTSSPGSKAPANFSSTATSGSASASASTSIPVKSSPAKPAPQQSPAALKSTTSPAKPNVRGKQASPATSSAPPIISGSEASVSSSTSMKEFAKSAVAKAKDYRVFDDAPEGMEPATLPHDAKPSPSSYSEGKGRAIAPESLPAEEVSSLVEDVPSAAIANSDDSDANMYEETPVLSSKDTEDAATSASREPPVDSASAASTSAVAGTEPTTDQQQETVAPAHRPMKSNRKLGDWPGKAG
ncbi:hypothetical protein HDZ31DRAFT_71794 [Schizophyllum fasciatum]